VTTSILEDYFTDEVAKLIYAPEIFDMALITDKKRSW